jgi:hypothetical protein
MFVCSRITTAELSVTIDSRMRYTKRSKNILVCQNQVNSRNTCPTRGELFRHCAGIIGELRGILQRTLCSKVQWFNRSDSDGNGNGRVRTTVEDQTMIHPTATQDGAVEIMQARG